MLFPWQNAPTIETAMNLSDALCVSQPFLVSLLNKLANKQADLYQRSQGVLHVVHKKIGCEWQGEVRTRVRRIFDHFVRHEECPKSCGTFVHRQRMLVHLENECVHREEVSIGSLWVDIETMHCGPACGPDLPPPCPIKCFTSRMPRGSISEHLKICSLENISCSNECGKMLLPKDLKTLSNCPHQIVCRQYYRIVRVNTA